MCCPLPKLTFVSSVSLMLEGEAGAWPGRRCQALPSITIGVGLINIWCGGRPVFGQPCTSRCGGALCAGVGGWWAVGLECRPCAGGLSGGAGLGCCRVNGHPGLCSALCGTSFARLGARCGPLLFQFIQIHKAKANCPGPRAPPALPPRAWWKGASWWFSEPPGPAGGESLVLHELPPLRIRHRFLVVWAGVGGGIWLRSKPDGSKWQCGGGFLGLQLPGGRRKIPPVNHCKGDLG